MCKVSIIIPAYNIEKYIERSILSCIQQSFKNIEIIVINDASTDNTLQIINKMKVKDNRIKVINKKKNQGCIEARKSGFEIAKGEYIMFVDGDDYIDDIEAIDILYKNAKKKNYDIVCYKFFVEDKSDKVKAWKTEFIFNDDDNMLDLLFQRKINYSLWSKFIRKEFIKENRIEFPRNFSYGEDVAFSYSLAMYNPRFIILNEYLYNYCRRSDSLDSSINEKTYEITKALQFIKEQLQKNNLYYKYKEEFDYLSFIQAYYIRKDYIFRNKNKISKDIYKSWKNLKIKINIKNNKFYRKQYEKDTMKAIILEEIFKKSYISGYLYYKIRR